MFFSKILFVFLVATLGTSWFSEGGFTAVDAFPQQYLYSQQYTYPQQYIYPQQYSGQYGTDNQQATLGNGYILQQHVGQIVSVNPGSASQSVIYYPTTNGNPYEGRPVLTFLDNVHKWKLCVLSGFTRC
nr:BV-like protein [Cotesia vestalis bracovirus]